MAKRDDLKLDFFPVALTTWQEWLAEHPDTSIISNDTGYYTPRMYQPEADPKSIYYAYRVDPDTMFPRLEPGRSPRRKGRGACAERGGTSTRAYPISDLNELRVVNDTMGDREIVILASSISSDARVFKREGRQFALDSDGQTPAVPHAVVDEEGQVWQVSDTGLTGPGGETLDRLPSYVSFWFGWYAFHPDTLLFKAE